MKRVFNALLFILSVSLLLGLIYFQQSVPKSHGEYRIPSLMSTVNVYKDKFGIPHIEAENDKDAYKVMGFLFASERLFQMDVLRRLVNGELSEIFGKDTLKADILLRKLRFNKSSQELINRKKNDPEMKILLGLLDAFREGVHEYMSKEVLPVEFSLLKYTPRKFSNAEIIGVAAYMTLSFAEEFKVDILNSKLAETLPTDKMQIIRPGVGIDEQYYSAQKVVNTKTLKNISDAVAQLERVVPLFKGSNSWVLSGSRTESGKPILANDPHIGVSNPHIFMEAHIKTPSMELYGHFIPLSPVAVLGSTPYSAWAITMGEIDILNLYEEKFHPEDPTKVMYKNEWVDVDSYEEIIVVKDDKPKKITVVVTPHGPTIDETEYSLAHKGIAAHWSTYHEDNNTFLALHKLPYAKTIDEFKEALSHAAAPSLNISWVNNTGDILWWSMGKYPKLADGVKTDRLLRGWDGSHDVETYYDFEENPHSINPESGVIVTANYKPMAEKFSHFQGYWQPGGRFFRLKKLLAEKDTLTIDDMKRIQTDVQLPGYKEVVKRLSKGIDSKKLSTYEKTILKQFLGWDGNCNITSKMCTVYHSWMYFIYRNTYVDELGEKNYETFSKTPNFDYAMKELLNNQNHSFWDNIHTERVESGEEVITKSFKNGLELIIEKLGKYPIKWDWGNLHTVEYVHPIGKTKPLNLFFNIGPYPVPGGRYFINNLGHNKGKSDFRVVHAPSTRRIVDMGNPRQSLGIIPTGNSGNPLSKHYSDQTDLYVKGEYRVQQMDWEIIKTFKKLKFVK